MQWDFRHTAGTIVVTVAEDVDVAQRLGWYQEGRGKVAEPLQQAAEVYAEATFLKYQSVSTHFGGVTSSLEQLQERLSAAGEEAFMLLEAARDDVHGDAYAGAILLRIAWTRDLIVDFVGTNPFATKVLGPEIPYVGAMLVYCGLAVSAKVGASFAYAETASHSKAWWEQLLAGGDDLIKVDDIPTALARITKIFSKAGITVTARE